MSRCVTFGVALLLLAGAWVSAADDPPAGSKQPPANQGPPVVLPGPALPGQFLPPGVQKKLKLTDEQKEKIAQLQKDLESKVHDLLTDEQKKILDELQKQARNQARIQYVISDEKPPAQPKDPAAQAKAARRATALAYSPDGKLLAVGSLDYKVRLYDAAGGKEIRVLAGHQRRYPIPKNGDGNRQVVGLPLGTPLEGTLRLQDEWYAGTADCVQSLAFSPDGRTLATGAADHHVRLWDVASGKETRALEVPYAMVRGLAFSPDGKLLASRGHDQGTVHVWEPASGKLLFKLGNLQRGSTWKGPFPGLAFSPDGQLLAVGDFGVLLFDTASGKLKLRLGEAEKEIKQPRHPDLEMTACRAVAFSPDGKLLATSASRLNKQGIWNVATGEYLRPLQLPKKEPIDDLAFSPDGKIVAAAVAEDYVQFFDPATGNHLAALEGIWWPHRLAFAPDGNTIAAITQSTSKKNAGVTPGVVHRWDVATRKEIESIGGK